MIAQMAANLVKTMECFTQFQPDSHVIQLNGITLIDAGPENASFNSVLLNAPVENNALFEDHIQVAKRYFEARGSAWSFWICEGLLSSSVRNSMERVFLRNNMHPIASTAGLVAETLNPPLRTLPELCLKRVQNDTTRISFCHLMSTSFDSPADQLTRIYYSDAVWKTSFQGFIGSTEGQDVTAGAVVNSHGVTGIYAVGTLPTFRRKGYAESLMRKMIQETQQQEGSMPLILQSTPAALNLYHRMGFRSLTNFFLYASK